MRKSSHTGTPIELGHVERLVALRSFPGAAHLDSADLLALASVGEALRFAPGERLLDSAERVGAMYVLADGTAQTRLGDGPLESVPAPAVIGVAHAFVRDAVGLEIDAESELVALRLAFEDIEDLFEDHPEALVHSASFLAREALDSGIVVRTPAALDGRAHAAKKLAQTNRPLDLVERLLALLSLPDLATTSLDAAAALASAATEVRRPRGAVLWQAGEICSRFAFLISGSVELTEGDRSHGTRSGEPIGWLECLAERTHGRTATVADDVVLLELDRDVLFDLWEDHPELGLEMMSWLGRALVTRASLPPEPPPRLSPPPPRPTASRAR